MVFKRGIVPFGCFLLGLSGLVFHALFFWVNLIVDSYFYWAIGTYFTSGNYPYLFPFYYDKATTISPPLYGLFLKFFELVSDTPQHLLLLFQLLLLGLTAILLYKTLIFFVHKNVAAIISLLFMAIPGNVIYASYMLTENGAAFFTTLYLYLTTRYFVKKDVQSLAMSIGIASVGALWKYALVVGIVISFALYIFEKAKKKSHVIPIAVGMLILCSWIGLQYKTTGVFGMSDASGVHLWNAVIFMGKMVPSEKSGAMKELRKYIAPHENLQQGYWAFQGAILTKENLSWKKVDTVLGNVAKEAIYENPLAYLRVVLQNTMFLHGGGMPYWENIGQFGNKNATPTEPQCPKVGKYQYCDPLIPFAGNKQVWNQYVYLSDIFYTHIFPIMLLYIFLPAYIIMMFQYKRYGLFLFILYLALIIPNTAYESPNNRYLIPNYSFIVLTITLGIHTCILWNSKRRGKVNHTHAHI